MKIKKKTERADRRNEIKKRMAYREKEERKK
jgi:hypothetical protein